jgi:hypothetical protein
MGKGIAPHTDSIPAKWKYCTITPFEQATLVMPSTTSRPQIVWRWLSAAPGVPIYTVSIGTNAAVPGFEGICAVTLPAPDANVMAATIAAADNALVMSIIAPPGILSNAGT